MRRAGCGGQRTYIRIREGGREPTLKSLAGVDRN